MELTVTGWLSSMVPDAKPRILLFGSSGQVGRELTRTLRDVGELITVSRAMADFAHPASLRAVVRELCPRVIVNAAAYTAVDRAESEADVAYAVNAAAPRVLAEEAERLAGVLVHYSTDYVFDGSKQSPYLEEDPANPLSTYGRTKLAGEGGVAESCHRCLVFRTSWVFSAHGSNFLKTMLRLASERDVVRVVADQHGAPTSAALISAVTRKVLQEVLRPDAMARWGVFHLAAAGETSWCEYARYAIEHARRLGAPLRTNPASVLPIRAADYPVAALRPANSRLNTTKLRDLFGIQLADWRNGVDQVLGAIHS